MLLNFAVYADYEYFLTKKNSWIKVLLTVDGTMAATGN